jgi:hypothetical protein
VPVLVGNFRHAVTRYRLAVHVYAVRIDSGLPLAAELSPGDPSSRRAGFFRIPSPNHPLSNLVAKGLRLAADSIV